ncbi:hypothetical protein ACIOG8_37690, partial [Streptomyces erythrochromogenes]|uniref:hypothetical protein n=1 Tax=Streptomyces erythrochromogenes TaxID=285574 RepID=UPI0037F796AF
MSQPSSGSGQVDDQPVAACIDSVGSPGHLNDHVSVGGILHLRGRLLAALSAVASAVVLPLAAASPASASAPVQSCNETHQARIFFWAVACTQPGQPVIGAFGTWRNV